MDSEPLAHHIRINRLGPASPATQPRLACGWTTPGAGKQLGGRGGYPDPGPRAAHPGGGPRQEFASARTYTVSPGQRDALPGLATGTTKFPRIVGGTVLSQREVRRL